MLVLWFRNNGPKLDTVKAVWGFNGTERPGAVYLAAVMAAFAQRGLPAFSMYGHDVQDIDDNTVPEDVAEKMIRWAKGAAWSVLNEEQSICEPWQCRNGYCRFILRYVIYAKVSWYTS